jgi:septal ring factor EnvC (AmiA/AmiB activator)
MSPAVVIVTTDEPAVNGWQAATEAHLAASTSALGRNLQEQLDQLRKEYGTVLLERDEALKQVDRLRGFWAACSRDRQNITRECDEAQAENERLRAQLDALPGYHLTDKGLAATAGPADPEGVPTT